MFVTATAAAQPSLQYRFNSGEHLNYHYKLTYRWDKTGERPTETVFEADPDWQINDVDMNGGAIILLTLLNRREEYLVGHQPLAHSFFVPQTELALDNKGTLVYAKITVDDTNRTLRKARQKIDPAVHVSSDFDMVKELMKQLWFAIDTLSIDTLGTPYIVKFDSAVQWGPKRTLERVGNTSYTLHDTLVSGVHKWHLCFVTEDKYKGDGFTEKRHTVDDVVFRKQDCIIEQWQYVSELHTGSGLATYKMSLDLTSIAGD
jgi:hypothetical protein